MRYDTTAVDKLISANFPTRKEFCKASGIAESALSRAFKRGKFSTDQINAICETLDIPLDTKMRSLFFTPADAKREQK